jgi:hypothetical protein
MQMSVAVLSFSAVLRCQVRILFLRAANYDIDFTWFIYDKHIEGMKFDTLL